MTKVGIIVDINGAYHASKTAIGGALCYQTLVERITKNRELDTGLAVFKGDTGIENPGFSSLLKNIGLRVKFAGRSEQSVFDAIATSIISIADRVDTIVLVTNNPAFGAIFDYLEMTGRKVGAELWFFESELDNATQEEYETIVNLDEEFLFKKKS